jgi:hypothetical protein
MAVRFDAINERYSSLQVGGAATAYTVACWARLEVNRLSLSTIWQIENGVGGNYLRVTAWNGSALAFQTANGPWNGSMSTTLTVGDWYYIGFSATVNPGQARFAIRAAGSSTFTTSTSSQANTTVTLGTLWLGSGFTASEWFNGSIAAVKVWNAALTAAELQDESWTYRPQRTDGLFGWHPLLTTSGVDSSGNHRPLSGGTGTTVADGPPIAWGRGRRKIVRAADPVVTGDLTATLSALTATGTGTVTTTGALAATLPPLAAAAAATVKTAGALTVGLPHLTATLTGAVGGAGVLAATLPALTATLQGTVRGGFLTPVLPALTAALTGTVRFTGTLQAALPALTASITGVVVIPPFDLVATAGPPQRGWGSGQLAADWAAATTSAPWAARQPATTWTAGPAVRAWKARQPTT